MNFLEQAQKAAQQRNWSLVNQCLLSLPLGKEDAASNPIVSPDWEQVYKLALAVLYGGDFQERWEVAKLFPKLGTRVHAPLIEILEDSEADMELRWFAVRILGGLNHPAVVTSLVELLRTSEEEELLEMATAALANLGSWAIDALTDLLAEEESRLLVVRSLAQIRRAETITPLLSIAQDPQVAIRVAAIEALGSFHDSRIPPVLMAALDDLAVAVRIEAVMGLSVRRDLREELNLVNRLKPLLNDVSLEVCSAAATALGRLGTNDAALALFEVLKSPTTPIPLQIVVVRALGWVLTLDALDYLRQGLTRMPAQVSQEIVTVLGALESPDLKPKAADILIEFLNSKLPVVQQSAIRQSVALALGQLGDTGAIHHLIQMLADSDDSVRLHAIAALKNLAPTAAHRQLLQLAVSDNLTPELKQGVAHALQEW